MRGWNYKEWEWIRELELEWELEKIKKKDYTPIRASSFFRNLALASSSMGGKPKIVMVSPFAGL